MLDFFWDHAGSVFLVAPHEVDRFDLVQLEAQRQGAASVLLGYGSPNQNPLGFVAFALPDIPDGEELRLLVQAFPPLSRHSGVATEPSHAQPIILANRAAPARAKAALWTVSEDEAEGLRPYIFTQQDPAPLRVAASLWTSRSEGNTVYPATRGGEASARPLVRIGARARRDEQNGIAFPIDFDLEFTCQPSAPLTCETVLTVYTLSATTDVMPLLVGTRGHRVRRNHETRLRLMQGTVARISVPGEAPHADEAPVWADADDDAPRAGDEIDFMDRIVIEAPIPLGYELQVDVGLPVPLQNHGSCALIYVGDGRLLEDTGGLLDRMNRTEDGQTGLEIFLRAMERNGYLIPPSDAEAASEILVLAAELTSAHIRAVYQAASVRLMPHDTRDFLDSPAYFGLISSTGRIESISWFTQDLSRGGADQPEAEKAGRFALFRLLDGTLAADADPGQKRLRLFATRNIHDGEGWDVVPLAVREDLRRAVAAGLVWDRFDIGSLIDFLGRSRNEPAITELSLMNDLLTDLGVLPLDFDAQFTTTPDLGRRLELLKRLHEDVLNLVAQSERDLDLASGLEAAFPDGTVLRRVLAETSAARHGFAAQALGFFRDQVGRIAKMCLSTELAPDANALAERLAGHFLHRIRGDCDIIDRIVASGYRNPLGAAYATAPGLGEAAGTFRRPLGQAQQDWLYGEDDRPLLVQHWLNVIRADYEAYNQPVRSDRT